VLPRRGACAEVAKWPQMVARVLDDRVPGDRVLDDRVLDDRANA
jgi:hypothetical protein